MQKSALLDAITEASFRCRSITTIHDLDNAYHWFSLSTLLASIHSPQVILPGLFEPYRSSRWGLKWDGYANSLP
jgi:hypothetical protein